MKVLEVDDKLLVNLDLVLNNRQQVKAMLRQLAERNIAINLLWTIKVKINMTCQVLWQVSDQLEWVSMFKILTNTLLMIIDRVHMQASKMDSIPR